jgi:hypothetical protein
MKISLTAESKRFTSGILLRKKIGLQPRPPQKLIEEAIGEHYKSEVSGWNPEKETSAG